MGTPTRRHKRVVTWAEGGEGGRSRSRSPTRRLSPGKEGRDGWIRTNTHNSPLLGGRQRNPTSDAAYYTANARGSAPRVVTPSAMRIKNKPPPIDTMFMPEFDWAKEVKVDPKRILKKMGFALACFCVVMILLGRDVSVGTLVMLQFWPSIYKQDIVVNPSDNRGVALWRAAADRAARFYGPQVDRAWIERIDVGGGRKIDIRLYKPYRSTPSQRRHSAGSVRGKTFLGKTDVDPILLYLHGGGFVTGGGDSFDGTARFLAHTTGLTVAMPDYALAPELPYPTALYDVLETLKFLGQEHPIIPPKRQNNGVKKRTNREEHSNIDTENNIDVSIGSGSVVIVGEDSGGNLAAAIGILVTEEGPSAQGKFTHNNVNRKSGLSSSVAVLPDVCATVLVYPLLEHDVWRKGGGKGKDVGGAVSASQISNYWRMYLHPGSKHQGGAKPSPPPLYYARPLHTPAHTLARQPPSLVLAPSLDPSHEDGLRWTDLVTQAGGIAESIVYPRSVRGFLGRTGHSGSARSVSDILKHIQTHCNTSNGEAPSQ